MTSDARLAAVQAITGLEAAVSHYIEARIQQMRRDRIQWGATLKEYKQKKKNSKISHLLDTVLPILKPDGVPYPQSIIDGCDRLREERNKAIHDPASFSESVVETGVNAVGQLLAFLVSHHPKPAT